MQPFFSIIIPTYNGEKYIQRCLESCINQTYQNIEIIVIDDFSQDQTRQILNQYTQKNQNIQIIYNDCNYGTFLSRIKGIESSRGNFLLFIDCDDYINEKTCEILHSFLDMPSKKNLDILAFDMEIENSITPPPSTLVQDQCILSDDMTVMFKYGWNLANKAFSQEVLKQSLLFIKSLQIKDNLCMAEDALFYFVVTLFARQYFKINSTLYYYCWNPYSASRDYKCIQKIEQNLQNYTSILNILQKIDHLKLFASKQGYKKTHKIITAELRKHQKTWKYLHHHAQAFEDSTLAYLINFSKSMQYANNPQRFFKSMLRILVFSLTLGRVKI